MVTEADIPELLKLGKASLYVFEAKEGMLHENDAAAILYDISAGEHMTGSEVKEGKIDIYAAEDGLFQVDVERLKAVNRLGEMMIATRHTNSPVRKGDKLAGTRVIPLVIESGKMERARQVAGDVPLLRIHPYRQRKAAVVVTGSEVDKGLIRDTFTPVVLAKLKEYGIDDVPHRLVGDDSERTVQAIRDFLADGAEIVLCTGGMSVDPDDRTPLAIKTVAERVVRYGAPVLPGAMFMLGYAKEGQAPVSYTHLDVYKRQQKYRSAVDAWLAGEKEATAGSVHLVQAVGQPIEIATDDLPTSPERVLEQPDPAKVERIAALLDPTVPNEACLLYTSSNGRHLPA